LQKEKADKKLLMDLRALAVLAFFMINALFVLVIFLLQLSRDVLHIRWPFGGRVDITFGDSQYEVCILYTN
jgi:chitin synthase